MFEMVIGFAAFLYILSVLVPPSKDEAPRYKHYKAKFPGEE